jgi:hypothetical protein
MMRPVSKRVRAAISIAMLAAGAPAVWGLPEALKSSWFEPYVIGVLLFLAWGTGWAVLSAWAWQGARASQGWRRGVGVLVTTVLALAALISLLFFAYYVAAEFQWGNPPAFELIALLCPGLLVGGVWLLSGLRSGRSTPSTQSRT